MKGPKEILSIVRSQTLVISNELSKIPAEETTPLKFHSKFSRFTITIINEERKAANGNIPIREMEDLIRRSGFAYQKELEAELLPKAVKGNEVDSPAYTVRFTNGTMKGKTPAQVLAEDPGNGSDALNRQYKWLQSNLNKYPKNQEQMDAIRDAARLHREGKLCPVTSIASLPAFTIYEPGFRPLIRKQREDGKSFVYEIRITWNFGQNYPVEVEIQNYYAPVIKKENGMLNVLLKEKSVNDSITNKMKLSSMEWMHVIHMLETSIRTFEDLIAPLCCDEVYKIQNSN